MENNILRRTRITYKANKEWLDNLQAGILKGHGRKHVRLLFLQFNPDELSTVRNLLAKLSLTTASMQHEQTAADKRSTETIMGCGLSHDGYKMLEVKVTTIDEAFKEGFENRREEDEEGRKLHFSKKKLTSWERVYQKEIHAIISLAKTEEEKLDAEVEKLKKTFGSAIEVFHIEKGKGYTNEHGKAIEHFGYVDGISQPKFFDTDFSDDAGKPIPENHWNPEAPVELALTKDIGFEQENCYGNYMVFQKLEQNVKAFKEQEEALAKSLGFDVTTEEAAGALIIGRFENGLPVVKWGSTRSFEADSNDNDFNYAIDPEGSRCPFHAHIRKTNPRGDSTRFFGISEEEERSRRIVRRGITYGERKVEPGKGFEEDDKPSKGVGLLFICFQSSIVNQFEFMQRNWANNNDFPKPFTGIDPIIGQGHNRKNNQEQALEQQWKSSSGQPIHRSLADFVKLKGGEYFFFPSVPFFQSLIPQV